MCKDRKVSGSVQARSRGRILHHGTLLVETDLDRLRYLLKEGRRSRTAPVVNLSEIVPRIQVEDVMAAFAASIQVSSVKKHLRGEE
jgi:lipoate-protein ligase A